MFHKQTYTTHIQHSGRRASLILTVSSLHCELEQSKLFQKGLFELRYMKKRFQFNFTGLTCCPSRYLEFSLLPPSLFVFPPSLLVMKLTEDTKQGGIKKMLWRGMKDQ